MRQRRPKFKGELGRQIDALWRAIDSIKIRSVEGGEVTHTATGTIIKIKPRVK